jgi:MFS family permease
MTPAQAAEAAVAAHAPLRAQRAFVLFVAARVASGLAQQMVAVAVGWQVYAITGSALDLGLVGLAQFLPAFALMLPAGQAADRFDRRRVLQACLVTEAAAALVLLAGSATGHIGVTAIFGSVMLIGAARAFQMPAMQAFLPLLVPRALLPRAIAVNASSTQAAVIVGPALGGLVYALGPAAVYGVSLALFVATALAIVLIRVASAQVRAAAATLRSVFAGIAFIRRQPEILGAISLDMFGTLLGGATALLPIYARDILHTGPLGLGLLRSSSAVGALAMTVWLARYPIRSRVGPRVFASVGVVGVTTIVFGVSTSFGLSLAALAALGAADMVSVVVRHSLVQLRTPDEMRGRVSAVHSLFIGTSNQLGEFESGVVAAWLGAVGSVVLGGLGTLVVVAACLRLFPTLARLDAVEREV